jgi:DNA polymerase-3 subunit epsilon
MDFVAIDIETANPDLSSICQIGVAGFVDGACCHEWKSYVDPQTWFLPANVARSGISQQTVAGAPTLPEIERIVRDQLTGYLVVSHTAYDRVALSQALERHCLQPIDCRWLDSSRVARRTWEQFAGRGYGLGDLCEFLGHEFRHHDALEDAKATGHVLCAAIQTSGLSAEEWFELLSKRTRHHGRRYGEDRVARAGNPDGPLFGEVIVFTGALWIPRQEAADLAARAGCEVADTVTKKTTLLVVGDQDVAKLAGDDKSAKHRKAEDLIAKGQPIRILRESDFARLVDLPE